MAFIVAIAGKGGTGKTTFAALLIKAAIKCGIKPLLAVDADPNYNLGDALGIKFDKTIADITDAFSKDKISLPSSMSKEAYLEVMLNSAITESNEVDLIVMGRPEGPGCYCYINNVLKAFLERLEKNYKLVVIDNEAGMEHISRRITPKVDSLVLVSDPSVKAVRATKRIKELAVELGLEIKNFGMVICQAKNLNWERLEDEAKKTNIPLWGLIPHDAEIEERDIAGREIMSLDSSSPAFVAVCDVAQKIFEPFLRRTEEVAK